MIKKTVKGMPLTYGWKILLKQQFVNKSIRLKNYDYDSPGAYFVTICEHDRKSIFGEVMDEEMILNEYGNIAYACLLEIPKHFKNVEAPEFVVMPNHIHAIIIMYDDFFKEKTSVGVKNNLEERIVGDGSNLIKGIVGGRHACHLQEAPKKLEKRQYAKLSVLVGSYKSAVTKEIHKLNSKTGFRWQRYFHDHIIRTERALENIADYIRLNPARWNSDLENESYRSGISRKEREKLSKEFYGKLLTR